MSEHVKNRVLDLFGDNSMYCAETVVTLIAEAGNRNSPDVMRMATGFCSGASRTCGQCGAVSGAIMGLGLYAGRTEPGGDYEAIYALVQEFIHRFEEKCGSVNCFELIGCDFATAEGSRRFEEKKLKRKCVLYCIYAVETALALLRENGYLPEHDEQVRSFVAPCGLACGKCVAYAGSRVQRLSEALLAELGDSFEPYAARFAASQPAFEGYDSFKRLLNFFATGSCSGCREGGCLFKSCTIPACVRERGVGFCFECDEFPCDRHGMPEGLAERWQANNEKMASKGTDSWYCGCLGKPRYP